MSTQYLFLVASTREEGHLGNTEWLARQAAQHLSADQQQWLHLARMSLPPFVDVRHTAGRYELPRGDLRRLLDATMACDCLVLVAPVYWYSFPSNLKTYLDHWSGFMRMAEIDFKSAMAKKTLKLVTTNGDRAKAQPMIDSTELCAQFLSMTWGGVLWGKGGPPDAVQADAQALEAATTFLL
jgi:putative NADPH-quinone reductase